MRQAGCSLSARPRILAPTLAAGMIALSLERLGTLHWAAAAALFVILEMFVVGVAVRGRGNENENENEDRDGDQDGQDR